MKSASVSCGTTLKQPNTHAIGTLREDYDKEITMNMHP